MPRQLMLKALRLGHDVFGTKSINTSIMQSQGLADIYIRNRHITLNNQNSMLRKQNTKLTQNSNKKKRKR